MSYIDLKNDVEEKLEKFGTNGGLITLACGLKLVLTEVSFRKLILTVG